MTEARLWYSFSNFSPEEEFFTTNRMYDHGIAGGMIPKAWRLGYGKGNLIDWTYLIMRLDFCFFDVLVLTKRNAIFTFN